MSELKQIGWSNKIVNAKERYNTMAENILTNVYMIAEREHK